MSRVTLILTNRETRDRAKAWIDKAPMNTRVEFKESKRSIPQNDRMHAMLTDIARQVSWHGIKLAKDDWKLIFLEAIGQEMRLVPNIAGNGFVSLAGRSSSDLSKEEMSDMIEQMLAFGAERGVEFNDPESVAARDRGSAKNAPRHAA